MNNIIYSLASSSSQFALEKLSLNVWFSLILRHSRAFQLSSWVINTGLSFFFFFLSFPSFPTQPTEISMSSDIVLLFQLRMLFRWILNRRRRLSPAASGSMAPPAGARNFPWLGCLLHFSLSFSFFWKSLAFLALFWRKKTSWEEKKPTIPLKASTPDGWSSESGDITYSTNKRINISSLWKLMFALINYGAILKENKSYVEDPEQERRKQIYHNCRASK